MGNKIMTEEEIKQWDDLYQYVRTNIFGYDSNQSLSKNVVLRLKGLLTNKFMENNHIEDTAHYSYLVILNAFKYSNPSIQKALRYNEFKDENHKFNYILKIVEKNINTVYNRMLNYEKAKEKTKIVDVNNASTSSKVPYKKRTEKTSSKLDKLW